MSNQIFSCDQGLATANEVSGRCTPFLVPLILTLVLLLGGLLSNGCSKSDGNFVSDATASALLSTNEVAAETLSAGNFMGELQISDRLPGVSKDDHGEMTSTKINFSATEHYPISRTFFIIKNGDQSKSKYYYQFTRISKASEWQLEKAWRTDSEGKTIEEFTIK